MKKYLKSGSFISILMLLLIGCGQPVVPSSQLTYTEIIEHKELASNSFEISKMWLANTFNDSKSVIEYSNKENGTIIGKGILKNVSYNSMIGTSLPMDTRFTLKIEVKDNKTRLTFQDMVQYPNQYVAPVYSPNRYAPQYVPPVEPFNMWNMESLESFKVRAKMDLVDNYKTYITNKRSNNW